MLREAAVKFRPLRIGERRHLAVTGNAVPDGFDQVDLFAHVALHPQFLNCLLGLLKGDKIEIFTFQLSQEFLAVVT